MIFRQSLVVSLLLVLAGCGSYRGARTELAASAIEDYNTVQADIQARLLVKNILRAKDRLPRHFTGLGTAQVAQQTATRLGPLGFNDDRSALNISNVATAVPLFKRTFQLGFDVQSTPRVDFSALDSKEFITGMTSTVRYDVLHYFQRQGWPIHLMELIFTREFQFGTDRFINDPGHAVEFKRFLALTESLARAGLELKVASRPPGKDAIVGPTFCPHEARDLEAQVMASQNGLRLHEVKDERCGKDASGKDIPAFGLAKPVTDNYWSFDACRVAEDWLDPAKDEKGQDGASRRASIGSSEFEDVVKAQVALAWRFAHSTDSNTRDSDIDAELTKWRTARATAHWKSLPGSLRDIRGTGSDFRFYTGVCDDLRQFQALRQGRCNFGDVCEVGQGTTLAQVQLNAATPEERNLRIAGKALLRSPESIVYYLGQVVRAQEGAEGPKLDDVRYWQEAGKTYRLMSLARSDQGANGGASTFELEVEHLGHTYVIAPKDDDRTMTVLNAVLLLIGLQRSAADLPTTPTVNVVGG